jgi:peroxiredoxin
MDLDQLAPEFTLPDLEGRIHMLSDYRGRLVVLNFWSAECPHTKRADREIMAAYEEWGQEVVLLPVAANTNETQSQIASVSQDRGLPLVLRDADQAVADRYEAQTTPHAFLIDRQGFLRYRGAVDDVTFRQPEPTRFFLGEAVKAVLSERLPEQAETQPFGCIIVRHA